MIPLRQSLFTVKICRKLFDDKCICTVVCLHHNFILNHKKKFLVPKRSAKKSLLAAHKSAVILLELPRRHRSISRGVLVTYEQYAVADLEIAFGRGQPEISETSRKWNFGFFAI